MADTTFKEKLENKINKCNRVNGSLKKLSVTLPTANLMINYKAFGHTCIMLIKFIITQEINPSKPSWRKFNVMLL